MTFGYFGHYDRETWGVVHLVEVNPLFETTTPLCGARSKGVFQWCGQGEDSSMLRRYVTCKKCLKRLP